LKAVLLDELVLRDAPICYGILMPGKHFDGGIPVIKVRDFTESALHPDGLLRTSPEIDSKFSRSKLRGGDLLLSIRGTTGRVLRIPESLDGANITQDSARIRVSKSLRDYLYFALQSPAVQKQIALWTIGQAVKRINLGKVRKLLIPIAEEPRQAEIVGVLLAATQAIHTTDALLCAKQEFKRGLMQELLTGRRRFPEFGQVGGGAPSVFGAIPRDWQLTRLGDLTAEVKGRNQGRFGVDRVKGVIKGKGLEPMREQVRGEDLRRYLVVPPRGFAYNPMRLNIGSLAFNCSDEECLVSPDYVVFIGRADRVCARYLDQLRHSVVWDHFIHAAGSGSVRVRIYYRDLARMTVPLPPISEQLKIAEVLDGLDAEITNLSILAGQFRVQRRGLLQRLFLGELGLSRRVTEPSETAETSA